MTVQSFNAFLKTPVPNCNFSKLNALFYSPDISSDITIFGERVITVKGEKGSVSLNALADKVVSVICASCLSSNDWPSNDTYDKVQATFVVDHLAQYYSQTDTLIAHANLFTRILAKIRDCSFTALRAYADVHYLNTWGFKVGYYITSWPWGDGFPPAWWG